MSEYMQPDVPNNRDQVKYTMRVRPSVQQRTQQISKVDLSLAAVYESEKAPQRESNAFVGLYRGVSWMLGFKEDYSLISFVIFGGGLLGFCLARIGMFSPRIMKKWTVPGDFFWFRLKLYNVNYFIHIYLTIIGGILIGAQFVPSIRRRMVLLHRMNGYVSLLFLFVGNFCGCIVAYKSVGGELNSQLAYYILALMLIFSGIMGLFNVKKHTRRHRRWMLRMVTYFSAIVTARVIMLCAREIVSRVGTYYSVWRCDEVGFLEPNYPDCSGQAGNFVVAVWASSRVGNVLNTASAVRVVMGMSLWMGTLMHVIGVEIFIHYTEEKNHTRYGYVLEPRDYEPVNGEEPWIYR